MAATSWRFWNAHHDERGSRRCTSITSRSARRLPPSLRRRVPPKGTEVRTVRQALDEAPEAALAEHCIVWRGDSHYGRVVGDEWMRRERWRLHFWPSRNSTLERCSPRLHQSALHHAKSRREKMRTHPALHLPSRQLARPRRVVARLEVFRLQRMPERRRQTWAMRQDVDGPLRRHLLKAGQSNLYGGRLLRAREMETGGGGGVEGGGGWGGGGVIKLAQAQLAVGPHVRVTAQTPIRCARAPHAA